MHRHTTKRGVAPARGNARHTNTDVGLTYPGERLKQLREAKGYTRKQLAQACGVSQSTISLIERGFRNPSAKLAVKLGHVLGEAGATIFLRAQLAKSPEIVQEAFGDDGGISNNKDDHGGGESDPRLVELQMRLYTLQAILSDAEFSLLLASLRGTLQAYEQMKR